MNEDQNDSPPANAMDRALMNYLEDILSESSPGYTRASAAKPDNVTPLEVVRPIVSSLDPTPQSAKSDSRQSVTLPFRTAEKPRVLTSLNLLNLNPAPTVEPVKSKPELVPVKTPVSAPPVAKKIIAEEPLKAIPEPEKIAPEIKAKLPVERVPVTLPPETVTVEEETRLPPVEEWCDNGRPVWAQHRFECLIFNVAGLKLAVPLMTLGAIHRIDRKFNALPHQSDWFIGILQTPASGNIKVLDTALCVMPERHDPAFRENLAYVITIHGYTWGLACHEVEKSITLEPNQVKWRTQRGKRPWLAGTVIDHMCALIDTDGFRDVILKSEKPC